MKQLSMKNLFSYCIFPERKYNNPKAIFYFPRKMLWFILLCFLIFPSISSAWTNTRIDETAFFWQEIGNGCSIAIDSEGFSHISYIDETYNDLYYATNESGYWDVTPVDTSVDKPHGHTSIAVDSDDNIHISYSTLNGGLKYAYKNPTYWTKYTVDSVPTTWTSIAVDATNNVHISYCYDSIGIGGPDSELRYAKKDNNTGEWTIHTIDSTGDVGYYNDIAVDAENNVHVCYYDKTNTALKYAYKSVDDTETGAKIGVMEPIAASVKKIEPMKTWLARLLDLLNRRWEISTIDNSGDVGRGCSLAIDPQGDLHISYQEDFGDSESLKYITNKSGDWESEYLDDMDTGATTSIAVDSWSNVHISYWSKDEASFRGEVKYIKKECGSWEDPEVADGGIYTHVSDSGSYDWPMPHSLAVDDSCNVHISAGTGRSLGYAFKEGVCSICSLSTFRSTFGLID